MFFLFPLCIIRLNALNNPKKEVEANWESLFYFDFNPFIILVWNIGYFLTFIESWSVQNDRVAEGYIE